MAQKLEQHLADEPRHEHQPHAHQEQERKGEIEMLARQVEQLQGDVQKRLRALEDIEADAAGTLRTEADALDAEMATLLQETAVEQKEKRRAGEVFSEAMQLHAETFRLLDATFLANNQSSVSDTAVEQFLVVFEDVKVRLATCTDPDEILAIVHDLAGVRIGSSAMSEYRSRQEVQGIYPILQKHAPDKVANLERLWREYRGIPDDGAVDPLTMLAAVNEFRSPTDAEQTLMAAVDDVASILGDHQDAIDELRTQLKALPSSGWGEEFYTQTADVLFPAALRDIGASLEHADGELTTEDVQKAFRAFADSAVTSETSVHDRMKERLLAAERLITMNDQREQKDTPAALVGATADVMGLFKEAGPYIAEAVIYRMIRGLPLDERPSETIAHALEVVRDPIFESIRTRATSVIPDDVAMFMDASDVTRRSLMEQLRGMPVGDRDNFLNKIALHNGNRATRETMVALAADGVIEDATLWYDMDVMSWSFEKDWKGKEALIRDLAECDAGSRGALMHAAKRARSEEELALVHEWVRLGGFSDPSVAGFVLDKQKALFASSPETTRQLFAMVQEYGQKVRPGTVAQLVYTRARQQGGNEHAPLDDARLGAGAAEVGEELDRSIRETFEHPVLMHAGIQGWDGIHDLMAASSEDRKRTLDLLATVAGTPQETGALQLMSKMHRSIISERQVQPFAELAAQGTLSDPTMLTFVLDNHYACLHENAKEFRQALDKLPEKDKIYFAVAMLRHTDSIDAFLDIIDMANADVAAYRLFETIYDRLVPLSPEKRRTFGRVTLRIAASPSQAMQRISRELMMQIIDAEDPDASLESINAVFVKNNLPDVAKTLRVFEVLNPKVVLDKKLQAEHLSPVLKAESHRGRMTTLYKDILKVHIDSGNASLREYVTMLKDAEGVMIMVDAEGVDALSPADRAQFFSFCKKLEVLYENSQLGRRAQDDLPEMTAANATAAYGEWRKSLGVKEGQSAGGRVAEMFLKPLGYSSFDAVLRRMDAAKVEMDARGRALASRFRAGEPPVAPGDLLKGIGDRFFRSTLQNGTVAKEFLGSSADSDMTPLDTDLSLVLDGDTESGIVSALAVSDTGLYGDIVMGFKDRGRFVRTDLGETMRHGARSTEDDAKYELFGTKVVSKDRHMGIRTGIASTETDFLIVRHEAAKYDMLRSHCMDIVLNGAYIPVFDAEGALVFSPEQFDAMRASFMSGIERMGGSAFIYEDARNTGTIAFQESLEATKREKQTDKEAIPAITKEIRALVAEVLQEEGIGWRNRHESLVGAEMHDTGSSGRLTNVPGSYDFDFILKLDPTDMQRVEGIQQKITARINALGGTPHEANASGQLRMVGVRVPGSSEGVDIDIGFVSKAELEQYESHDAVHDRLNAIRTHLGDAAHEDVIVNITLAKKMLKEAKAYKKGEHGDGGLGGIGVENWILAHNGNVLKACAAFVDAAFDGDAIRPLNDLRARYAIVDPGINVKFGNHDNFTRNFTAEGYERMALAAREYVASHTQKSTM